MNNFRSTCKYSIESLTAWSYMNDRSVAMKSHSLSQGSFRTCVGESPSQKCKDLQWSLIMLVRSPFEKCSRTKLEWSAFVGTVYLQTSPNPCTYWKEVYPASEKFTILWNQWPWLFAHEGTKAVSAFYISIYSFSTLLLKSWVLRPQNI